MTTEQLIIPKHKLLLTKDIYLHHNCGFIVTQQRVLSKKTDTPTLSMSLTFNGSEAAVRGIKRYYNVDVSVEEVSALFVEATRIYFVETNAAARKNLGGKGNLFKSKKSSKVEESEL